MRDPTIIIAYNGVGASVPRQLAYARVLTHLQALNWPIRIAIDEHQPYRLSHAVNRCVRNHPCDLFVLHYADVMVALTKIREAAKIAAEREGQVFAYTEYVRVEEPDGSDIPIPDWNANACVAMQRDWFLRMGGYDERYVGWGMEDADFTRRCVKAGFPPVKVPGRLEHLWHGDRREDDSMLDTPAELVRANRSLYESQA